MPDISSSKLASATRGCCLVILGDATRAPPCNGFASRIAHRKASLSVSTSLGVGGGGEGFGLNTMFLDIFFWLNFICCQPSRSAMWKPMVLGTSRGALMLLTALRNSARSAASSNDGCWDATEDFAFWANRVPPASFVKGLLAKSSDVSDIFLSGWQT